MRSKGFQFSFCLLEAYMRKQWGDLMGGFSPLALTLPSGDLAEL